MYLLIPLFIVLLIWGMNKYDEPEEPYNP